MQPEIIEARFSNLIYESDDKSYQVASFASADSERIVVTGALGELKSDALYKIIGNYTVHKKYGTQFKASLITEILPKKKDHILSFLSSSRFKGIGKKTAEKIVNKLGNDCLVQIRDNPQILKDECGLKQDKIDAIVEGLSEFEDYSDLVLRLLGFGLPISKIELLLDHYDDVEAMLEDDCYDPMYRVPGFGYKYSELLANSQKLPANDFRRLKASIFNWLDHQRRLTGNTCFPVEEFRQAYQGTPKEAFYKAIEELSLDNLVAVDEGLLFVKKDYQDEWEIARLLKKHMFACEQVPDDLIDDQLDRYEEEYAIQLDPLQRKAVHTFFKVPVMILNGGPGTGKSTTVKAILQLILMFFEDCRIQLAAPTGKAAKRLAELSDVEASTIHALLKWDLDRNKFGINQMNPLEASFLIIDEFSMVDSALFANLLKGLDPHCRILLIGDEDQLESVSPGNVFSDLIESKAIPMVSLQTLFRQQEGSGIAALCDEIRNGKPLTYENGVSIYNMSNEEMVEYITQMAQEAPLDNDIQVLGPKYKGDAGIDVLNVIMQSILNPADEFKDEYLYGTVIFRTGDRIMLTKNFRSINVFNGDVGTISMINEETREFEVEFDNGETVTFKFSEFDLFKHAWAVSIHKSQGSEYQQVICSIPRGTSFMLTKKMLYTAFSRAKKRLVILADPALIDWSIKKTFNRKRMTRLKERIISVFSGQDPFLIKN